MQKSQTAAVTRLLFVIWLLFTLIAQLGLTFGVAGLDTHKGDAAGDLDYCDTISSGVLIAGC